MYEVVSTKAYRTALKRVSRQKDFDIELLEWVVDTLARDEVLPQKFRDHALTGCLKGYRECHVKNDLLLVYQKQNDVLVLLLVDVGSHAALF